MSPHTNPPSKDSPFRLLVEGPDDKCSIINLMKQHGFNWDDSKIIRPYIEDAGGIDKLLEEIPVAIKSVKQRLGIVVDADINLRDRWQALSDLFSHERITLPKVPNQKGTIILLDHENKKYGIWIMPDNSSPGYLENFLTYLVPPNDQVWPFSESSTTEAMKNGSKLKKNDFSKGVIHCWLSWQEDPGLPFGTAINARIFNSGAKIAQDFVIWFQSLFNNS